MRAKEFIFESTGTTHEEHDAVHQGFSRQRDPGGYNPSYHQYRTGLALAMANGSNEKLDIDHESWMGPFWTFHPYTDIEHKMVNQVKKVIPTEYDQVKPRSPSREPETVHKISPVAAKKKNRYGV